LLVLRVLELVVLLPQNPQGDGCLSGGVPRGIWWGCDFRCQGTGRYCACQGNVAGRPGRGLSRESLYKALSGERSPDFETILRVVNALGLKLHAEAAW